MPFYNKKTEDILYENDTSSGKFRSLQVETGFHLLFFFVDKSVVLNTENVAQS